MVQNLLTLSPVVKYNDINHYAPKTHDEYLFYQWFMMFRHAGTESQEALGHVTFVWPTVSFGQM